jgi:hypothetical protein
MNIELWKEGWYIINGPDPVELKIGPFLTFQEAYEILNRIGKRNLINHV